MGRCPEPYITSSATGEDEAAGPLKPGGAKLCLSPRYAGRRLGAGRRGACVGDRGSVRGESHHAITLSHGPHRKHHGLALAPDGLRDGHTGSAPFRRQDAGPLGMGSDRASPHLVLQGLRPGCVARGLAYKVQGNAPDCRKLMILRAGGPRQIVVGTR